MTTVVVGAKGTLGERLVGELGATGVDFRAHELDGRWRAVVASADVVVNVGGPRVRPGLTASDYLREHVGVARSVISAMRSGAHLVHVSSTAVFGARGVELSADAAPAPERFPMPDYAAAKLAAEEFVAASAPARGLALTILRPSMVYGPGVDSALESLRRLAARRFALRLRPEGLRQHLVHLDLFVAVVRAAVARPTGTGPRPLLVADPFVLRNLDLDLAAALVVPLPLTALALVQRAVRTRLGRSTPKLDSLAVLALDNVFAVDETFERLGLSRDGFDRRATFDRYFAS